MSFTPKLVKWYANNKRNLPWRLTDNPYVIWVAEVVFQQTRIEQGMPFFMKFLEKFPTVAALASAKQEEVLKKWQGLGYYSRARNLHYSAQYIMHELQGVFPSTYSGLLTLKGVGPYIAAEVASVCFNEPVAAVDGNVQRVIARLFDVHVPVNSTAGAKIIQSLSQAHLDVSCPGDYNQALMELGALLCTPKHPNCLECPVQTHCESYAKQRQEVLPVKEKKGKIKDRYFDYFLVIQDGNMAMEQRGSGDVWQGMYQPMLREVNALKQQNATLIFEEKRVLSHQRIYMRFYVGTTAHVSVSNRVHWVPLEELRSLPVSKSIENLFSSSAFNEFINTFV